MGEPRSGFLMTLGLLAVALPQFIWHRDGDESSTWPGYGWGIFFCILAMGVDLLCVAFTGSSKTVAKWADAISIDEASILVMVVAAPVYFVLRWLSRKR